MLGGIIGPGTGSAGTELGAVSAVAAASAVAASCGDSVLALVAGGNTSTDVETIAAASRSACRRLASAIASVHHINIVNYRTTH